MRLFFSKNLVRQHRDFYPTPLVAFTPLLPYIPEDLIIWEPACGDRRLIKVLLANGFTANGSDFSLGYDFLSEYRRFDAIITNPPFSLAFQFVRRSVKLADHVFLLLRLNFLASQKRADWFKKNEPSALFVLINRPSFTGGGTDMTDYAWFYWGAAWKGIFHI